MGDCLDVVDTNRLVVGIDRVCANRALSCVSVGDKCACVIA